MVASKLKVKKLSPGDSPNVGSPNKRQTRSQTQELIKAFENLDIDHADKLIFHEGVDPSVIDPALLTRSLLHAVKVQNTPLVRELLKYQPELKSVLYCAVENEALGIVEELLRRGVEIRDEDKRILSMVANSSKAAEMLELLFQYNCISLETRDNLSLKAIFNFIEQEPDQVAAIEKLLDLGMPVDQTNRQGVTALHYAVDKNRMKVVELLLAHGADVNKKTYRGTTPIMLAVSLPESTIAALLIRSGANIHDCDNNGRYPIHIACNSGVSRNIRLLIRLGVNVNVIDQLDFTPFSSLRDQTVEPTDIFLKHFAFLRVCGSSCNSTDLASIQSDEHMSSVYNACLAELERMKETEFTSGVTYYDLIRGRIEKLSILTKNSEFVDQFRKDQSNVEGRKFSWVKYSEELDIALEMAEKRRDLLIAKEAMLRNIFSGVLPQVVLDKVARYLLFEDLSSFQKEFYLSMFSNENRM